METAYRRWLDFELPFHRTLEEIVPDIDIKYMELRSHRPVAHLGQRKLFFSELEYFLLIYEKELEKMHDMLVVYVGAAPGSHTNLLVKIFPQLNFLLYDPNPFKIPPSDKVKIMTGDAGMFTLNSIEFVKEYAAGREVIFICDMRLFVSEENVWKEMTEQQAWGILLGAKYMLLKMRPPYVTDETEERDYTEVDPVIADRVTVSGDGKKFSHPYLYLAGPIYTQIYPPKTSSETRLFVTRGDDGKYPMVYRDYLLYENQCYYFNAIYRGARFRYGRSRNVPNELFGYDDGYESTTEYFLVEKMLSLIKYDITGGGPGRPSPTYEEIIRVLDHIDIELTKLSNMDNIISEIFDTMIKGYVDYLPKELDDEARFKKAKIVEVSLVLSRLQIAAINTQQNNIRTNGKVLSEDRQKKRLEIYSRSSHSLVRISPEGVGNVNVSIINKIIRSLQGFLKVYYLLCLRYFYATNGRKLPEKWVG